MAAPGQRDSLLSSLWIACLTLSLVAPLCAGEPEPAGERRDDPKLARQELEAALQLGDFEGARRLVENGTDPTHSLISSARRGEPATVEWLLDAGADVSGRLGARALLYALKQQDPSVAELLRAHGADVDGADASGVTLLMAMARSDAPRRRTQRALLDAGANVNAKSLSGRTPLMFAVRSGRPMDVRLLLSSGADVDATDRDGWSSLMLAVRDGRLPLVDELLTAGADPAVASAIGWTPLMWAAWLGHSLVLDRLLAAGADPNQGNEVVGTPLLRAVQARRLHLADRLLAAGARADSLLGGVDVLGWAELSGNPSLLRMIREAR